MDIRQTNPDEVVTYSEINRAAIQNRETLRLRCWYWLRKDITNGSGHLPYTRAVELLMQWEIKEIYAKQLLKAGNGTWWTISNHRVILTGTKRIVARYELRSEGTLVVLAPSDFYILKQFKAKLYASWFAKDSNKAVDEKMRPIGGKVVSRKTINKQFNLSKRTQKRYEKTAKIKKEKCLAYAKKNSNEYEHLPLSTPQGEIRGGIWQANIDGDGNKEIVWQIPNRYCTDLEMIGRKKRYGESGNYSRAKHLRVYFDKPNAASKALSSGNTKNLYLLEKRKRGINYFSYEHQ